MIPLKKYIYKCYKYYVNVKLFFKIYQFNIINEKIIKYS